MIKKQLLLILLIFASSAIVFGQLLKPVKWSFEQKPAGNGEIELIVKAAIDPGCIYIPLIYPKVGQSRQLLLLLLITQTTR